MRHLLPVVERVRRLFDVAADPHAIARQLRRCARLRPLVGARFRMKTQRLSVDGWVEAEVTELDPPRRMVWAWSVSAEAPPTTVTFDLAPEGDGTRLRLTHVGEIDAVIGGLLTDGWPRKLESLRRSLD